jgi:hypothetical protein
MCSTVFVCGLCTAIVYGIHHISLLRAAIAATPLLLSQDPFTRVVILEPGVTYVHRYISHIYTVYASGEAAVPRPRTVKNNYQRHLIAMRICACNTLTHREGCNKLCARFFCFHVSTFCAL